MHVHICVYVCAHECVYICGGPRFMLRIILIFNGSSTLFDEAGSVRQTQSLPIWLVSLSSFLRKSHVSFVWGWDYRLVTIPTGLWGCYLHCLRLGLQRIWSPCPLGSGDPVSTAWGWDYRLVTMSTGLWDPVSTAWGWVTGWSLCPLGISVTSGIRTHLHTSVIMPKHLASLQPWILNVRQTSLSWESPPWS